MDTFIIGFIQRNFSGSGDAKAVIGKDKEILDKGLRKGNQPEFFRADYPDKIRQDKNR